MELCAGHHGSNSWSFREKYRTLWRTSPLRVISFSRGQQMSPWTCWRILGLLYNPWVYRHLQIRKALVSHRLPRDCVLDFLDSIELPNHQGKDTDFIERGLPNYPPHHLWSNSLDGLVRSLNPPSRLILQLLPLALLTPSLEDQLCLFPTCLGEDHYRQMGY